ncbi:MAG: galactose oxidase-like domain-containing protein [Planctomycetota bacterium]
MLRTTSQGDADAMLLNHRIHSRLIHAISALSVCSAVVAAQPLQSTQPAPAHVPANRIARGSTVLGNITVQTSGAPVDSARVTVFRSDLSFFRETRSLPDGTYLVSSLPPGSFSLGIAARGYAYQEVAVNVTSGASTLNFALTPETHPGAWNVIGDTSPEVFDGTDIGILRPDGTIMYCHDTQDPVLFDPVTGQKTFPPGSGTEQGCMNGTLLVDGGILMVGGQSPSDPGAFTNAVAWVKRFTPLDFWIQQSNMLLAAGRWYPGLARLADGRLLVMGGGTAPTAQRTDTCEVYSPATQNFSFTDTMNSPLEFPPSALLYTGKVLRTWGTSPELYDPLTAQWQPTGAFNFPSRGFPGHSDHSLIVLADGRALAVGVSRVTQPTARMIEIYDPATGQWSLGPNPSLVRMQAEVVHLPDGNIFVGAGDQETTAGAEPNVLGIVERCDLFDPVTLGWRRIADMLAFREYHAVTLLVPDGRVVTTGGTRIKFQVGPTTNAIEAYRPPYLFRGVRPQISSPSDTTPSRGATVSLDVFPQTQLTSFVLMGLQSTTHWVDAGVPRRLVLPVTQNGADASLVLPTDPDVLPLGWYMLFGMVDDIPSVARILRVDA